jgi:hypothetical protein
MLIWSPEPGPGTPAPSPSWPDSIGESWRCTATACSVFFDAFISRHAELREAAEMGVTGTPTRFDGLETAMSFGPHMQIIGRSRCATPH